MNPLPTAPDTLAALKRSLRPNQQLLLIHTLLGPVCSLRTIKEIKPTYLSLLTPEGKTSYLYWPRAATYEPVPNGFRFMVDGEIIAQYQFVAD